MKRYTVEITNEALSDMEQLYNYIAYTLQAPENAMGQYNRISDEILKLDTLPERFRVLDLEPENANEIRRMVVDSFSVFYIIKDDRVIVTNVLYNGSDVEKRLKD